MKPLSALLIAALSAAALPPRAAAADAGFSVSTSGEEGDRYEVARIPVLGGVTVRLDRFSGATHSLSGRKNEGTWKPIRNDELDGKTDDGRSRYRIHASIDEAVLYDAETGAAWKLTFGPTGYNLYWTPLN